MRYFHHCLGSKSLSCRLILSLSLCYNHTYFDCWSWVILEPLCCWNLFPSMYRVHLSVFNKMMVCTLYSPYISLSQLTDLDVVGASCGPWHCFARLPTYGVVFCHCFLVVSFTFSSLASHFLYVSLFEFFLPLLVRTLPERKANILLLYIATIGVLSWGGIVDRPMENESTSTIQWL